MPGTDKDRTFFCFFYKQKNISSSTMHQTCISFWLSNWLLSFFLMFAKTIGSSLCYGTWRWGDLPGVPMGRGLPPPHHPPHPPAPAAREEEEEQGHHGARHPGSDWRQNGGQVWGSLRETDLRHLFLVTPLLPTDQIPTTTFTRSVELALAWTVWLNRLKQYVLFP